MIHNTEKTSAGKTLEVDRMCTAKEQDSAGHNRNPPPPLATRYLSSEPVTDNLIQFDVNNPVSQPVSQSDHASSTNNNNEEANQNNDSSSPIKLWSGRLRSRQNPKP